ncbi:MAG: hypothetical protein QOF18_2786 [Frankiaceae bacterium]|jgi:phage protein D|nr:hypothetical protein [Frankiaceae bacterium]
MPTIGQIQKPLVFVGGTELSEAVRQSLVELRIEMQMRLPGMVQMRFEDPDGSVTTSGTFAMGKAVQVKMPGGDAIIDAEITGIAFEASEGSTPHARSGGRMSTINELVVTAYDKAYKMTRNCTIKGHESTSSSDIVGQIARAAGLRAATAATSSLPYVAQAHSDFDMLNALADRVGFDWWVSAGNILHFAKASGGATTTLKLGTAGLTSFSVRASGLAPDTISVRGWLPKQQQDLTQTSQLSESALWPSGPGFVTGSNGAKHNGTALGTGTLITSAPGVASVAEAKAVADGLRDRLAAASVTAKGTGAGNAAIVLGSNVAVQEAGPINGTYQVTKVEHVLRRSTFETKFVAGDRTPTGLVDSLADGQAGTMMPLRHDGLVIGTVTGVGDDEHKGLLRVKFPGLDQQLSSAWARFLAVGAGGDNARGFVALPEVGDEVLVGFEEGDVHRPVVIGGLYTAGTKVGDWDVQDGKVMSRRFISRQGHVFEIKDGDEDASKHFKFTVKGGKGDVLLRVGADKVDLTTPDDVPVKVTAGQGSFEIDGHGNITLKGQKITIDAVQQLDLHGAQVGVKADQQLALEGSLGASLKGLKVDVEAETAATIKGTASVAIN